MLPDVEAVLANDPSDAEALMARAAARILKQDYTDALTDCNEVPRQNGNDYRIDVLTGLADAGLGNVDNANLAFGRAVATNPDCVLARLRHADLNLQGGFPKVAIVDLDYIITKLEPQNDEALELRGQCHDRLKQYDEAFTDYITAFSISNRGNLLVKAGASKLNREERERMAKSTERSQDTSDKGTPEPTDVEKHDRFPAVNPPREPGGVLFHLQRFLDGVNLYLAPGRALNRRAQLGNSNPATNAQSRIDHQAHGLFTIDTTDANRRHEYCTGRACWTAA
jgi:tetratricopeptide (TPR) repeat protein